MRALRERRAGPLAITDVVGRYRSGNGERPGSHPSQEARNGGPWCMNPSEAGGGGWVLEEGTQRPKQERGRVWVGEAGNDGDLEGTEKGRFWASLLLHLSCEAKGSLEGFSAGKMIRCTL